MRGKPLGAAVASALLEAHEARARAKSMTAAKDGPSRRVALIQARQALPARLLARLRAALRRYRRLIQKVNKALITADRA